MHGSWFLFFFMVHAGNLIQVLDGSLQGWIEQEQEEEDTPPPTCQELREFWNVMSRSVKMSESTNEIPLMAPLHMMLPYAAEGRRQRGRKKQLLFRHNYPPASRNSIQDIFFDERLPPDPKELFSPSKEHLNPFYVPHPPSTQTEQDSAYGVFGRFPSPEEMEGGPRFGEWSEEASTVLSGTKKKAGSEMLHAAPSWGLPEEVGMFGRFVDLEEGLPLIGRHHHPSGARPDTQGFSGTEPRRGPTATQDLLTTSREPCNQVANKHCISDEECECSGWSSLRCQRGKCRSHSLNKGQDNEFGYWHEAALPTSKLGLFKRSQRSTKSIFM